MVDLGLTIAIIYRAIVLFRKEKNSYVVMSTNPSIPKIPALKSGGKTPGKPAVAAPASGGLSPAWTLTFIFMFVMICFGHQIVAAGSLNFFVWGDHLLGADRGNPPVLMWALLGLGIGAVTGSLVVWRKYHVQFRWCLATLVPLLLILILLQGWRDPLGAIEPRAVAVAVDSTRINAVDPGPATPRRKKYSTRKKPAKTNKPIVATQQVSTSVQSCASQLTNVSIHARSDSVNIYYRTASYQDGPWGEWRSKFIPQQGHFSLTDGGLVRANSLQYYYESKSVMTRSAQTPYSRKLCDEELVIDTY
jgi:hypothetical protein